MKYVDQLKDPRWQKKRLEVMQISDFTCEECFKKDKQLTVHHSFYKKGVMLWEYPNTACHCVCMDCHIQRSECEHALLMSIWGLDITQIERLASLMNYITVNHLYCVDVIELFEESIRDFHARMNAEFEKANPDGIMEIDPLTRQARRE